MDKKFNLDSFGKIIDDFLEQNTIHMLLTLPEGTLDVQVQDNTGLGSVVQFYILTNSIKTIAKSMRKDMGIDGKSPEWGKTVDTLLDMIRNEMLEGETE